MLGLLRPYIEGFDLRRYPHEFPPEANPFYRTYDIQESKYRGQYAHANRHGHIKNYLTGGKGYTTLYDIGVYIILVVFLGAVVRETFVMFPDEKNKSYMCMCLIIIICAAVLF